jgi:hypothetical protein
MIIFASIRDFCLEELFTLPSISAGDIKVIAASAPPSDEVAIGTGSILSPPLSIPSTPGAGWCTPSLSQLLPIGSTMLRNVSLGKPIMFTEFFRYPADCFMQCFEIFFFCITMTASFSFKYGFIERLLFILFPIASGFVLTARLRFQSYASVRDHPNVSQTGVMK